LTTGTVIDDKGLAQGYAELLAERACDQVDTATDWQRDDDFDRFIGIFALCLCLCLCLGLPGESRRGKCARYQH
jgi:hypothetical protein